MKNIKIPQRVMLSLSMSLTFMIIVGILGVFSITSIESAYRDEIKITYENEQRVEEIITQSNTLIIYIVVTVVVGIMISIIIGLFVAKSISIETSEQPSKTNQQKNIGEV